MSYFKLIAITLLVACDKVPPPVKDGKCLVDVYEGTRAKKQTCQHAGYTWTCTQGQDEAATCVRGPAAQERQ